MPHSRDRIPFEFDRETKREALERSGYRCEKCGCEDDRTNRLEVDHRVAIWFFRETGCIGVNVLLNIVNCSVLCHRCHQDKHKAESRAYYRELAPQILAEYLQQMAEEQDKRDAWRNQQKGKYAGHD